MMASCWRSAAAISYWVITTSVPTAKINGIGALDHYTLSQENNRFIGDIVIHNEEFDETYYGFENHNGRTFLGKGKTIGESHPRTRKQWRRPNGRRSLPQCVRLLLPRTAPRKK